MEFDYLLSSGPEAQIALMNTMLQLEMALNDGSLMGDCTPSPPVSPVENSACTYSFSPPPQYVPTSTCTGAAAGGYYQDAYYSKSAAPAAYGVGVQMQEFVMSSSSPGAVDGPGGLGGGGGGGAVMQGSTSPSPSDAMRDMIFHIAALQPVNIEPEAVRPPKRRNVRTSKDPQSVAARMRRERISERIHVLQRLVPGGTKMDTASMLDEAIHYVKFLKSQVQSLELAAAASGPAHHAAAYGVAYPATLQHAPW